MLIELGSRITTGKADSAANGTRPRGARGLNMAQPAPADDAPLMETPERIRLAPSVEQPPVSRKRNCAQRQLWVYTRDPSIRQQDGQQTLIAIPFEPLPRNPGGRLMIEPVPVRSLRPNTRVKTHPELPRLDDPAVVADDGLRPSSTNPNFAQQMVYAVAAWTQERFRRALGREPDFAFDGPLHLRVLDGEMANAYYDPEQCALRFGYFFANADAPGRNQEGALVHTALSHDIIVHEMAHALLDGMRSHLMLPTNPDVLAFHEGFADLVALLAHFSHREILERAIGRNPQDLDDAMLVDLGRQFGQSFFGGAAPLRHGVPEPGDPEREERTHLSYRDALEPHDRGMILTSAVLEAFRAVYRRKTADLRAQHRDRSQAPPESLVRLLAKAAAKLAEEFLDIAIRAIDYLPPVDVYFGEYLRALITADKELVPDDEYGYREALVYAFRRHGISVDDVLDLSEDSLLWDCPDPEDLNRQALRALCQHPDAFHPEPSAQLKTALAAHVRSFIEANANSLLVLGLQPPDAEEYGEICIESVRSLRRSGANRSLALGFVIELTQQRQVQGLGQFMGGCTLILDEQGAVDYVIRKRVSSAERLLATRRFLAGSGFRYAKVHQDPHSPRARAELQRSLHGNRYCGCPGRY